MALVVQKYGGFSVADADGIHRVARRVVQTRRAGHDVAIVVSAMGDTTDDLLDLTQHITDNPTAHELDMLLTAGEQISMALLAMAIHELDCPAVSFTGSRPVYAPTTSSGPPASLTSRRPASPRPCAPEPWPSWPGFQGGSEDDDVATIGRGGSDTTAVALATALKAAVCEIYTDVDGRFSADPPV